MAEDKSQGKPAGNEEDVEDLVGDTESDTLKVPSEAETDPKLSNVEGTDKNS